MESIAFANIALAVAPPRASSGSRQHRFRLESRGRGFPVSVIHERDGRFLAPTGYPVRRDVQEPSRYRRDTCRRYDRPATFVFRQTRIVRSLINCLSHAYASRRVSHARRCRTNRPLFQEVVSLPAFLPAMLPLVPDATRDRPLTKVHRLYLVRCSRRVILGKYIFVTDKITAV